MSNQIVKKYKVLSKEHLGYQGMVRLDKSLFVDLSEILKDCLDYMTNDRDKQEFEEFLYKSSHNLSSLFVSKTFDFRTFESKKTNDKKPSSYSGERGPYFKVGTTVEKWNHSGRSYIIVNHLNTPGSAFIVNMLKNKVNGLFTNSIFFIVKSFTESEIEIVFDLEVNKTLGFDNGLGGVVNWNESLVKEANISIEKVYVELFSELYKVSFNDYSDLKNNLTQYPIN